MRFVNGLGNPIGRSKIKSTASGVETITKVQVTVTSVLESTTSVQLVVCIVVM